jgi:hypothetical protein
MKERKGKTSLAVQFCNFISYSGSAQLNGNQYIKTWSAVPFLNSMQVYALYWAKQTLPCM